MIEALSWITDFVCLAAQWKTGNKNQIGARTCHCPCGFAGLASGRNREVRLLSYDLRII